MVYNTKGVPTTRVNVRGAEVVDGSRRQRSVQCG